MVSISLIPSSTLICSFIHHALQKCNEWTYRIVKVISHLPNQMQTEVSTTVSVFLTINALFFVIINLLANALTHRLKNVPKDLDKREKRFNCILINGVIVGGSLLSFNIILSKLTPHSLNGLLLLVPAITAIAFRYLFTS